MAGARGVREDGWERGSGVERVAGGGAREGPGARLSLAGSRACI